MKKTIIITSGKFPEGEAGALRLRLIGRALVETGNEVTVLCRGNANKKGEVDGIKYISLRTSTNNKIEKVADYFRFNYRIKRYLKNTAFTCIYVYNAPISTFNWLKREFGHSPLKLVHDCVEWYSAEEFRFGRLDPAYIIKNYINKHILTSGYKIIAISSYLEKYFKQFNVPVLYIPMICEIDHINLYNKDPESKLRILYAGWPGKKDYIGNVIKALNKLNDSNKKKVSFRIYGCKSEDLISNQQITFKELKAALNSGVVEICGRVSREHLSNELKESDFIILPRDSSQRYAKAGFPSKVVEALAHSTPIICNYSSDLNMYLKDGYNAIIAEDHTPDSLLVAINRALLLSREQKIEMSENARRTAESKFDFRIFSEELDNFIYDTASGE